MAEQSSSGTPSAVPKCSMPSATMTSMPLPLPIQMRPSLSSPKK